MLFSYVFVRLLTSSCKFFLFNVTFWGAIAQVGHSFEALGEEPIILTLADHSVLDEHGDDVNMEEDELENINLREIEKAKKNRELLGKDFRTQYDPTDDLQQGVCKTCTNFLSLIYVLAAASSLPPHDDFSTTCSGSKHPALTCFISLPPPPS